MSKGITRRLVGIFALSLLLGATTQAESPVADAAQAGDAAQVRALLQQGADVNAAQADGLTALHWAAMNNSVEIVDLLVYAGATLRPLTRVGGYTPLHLASRSGHGGVVSALIEARSCERFELLSRRCSDRELAKLYAGLWASEQGHYRTFIDLARTANPAKAVEKRWPQMLKAEARLIQAQPPGPGMHSGVAEARHEGT